MIVDPITLATAARVGRIIANHPLVRGAAAQFWAHLTATPPTMTELLAQQRELAVQMAEPSFSTDFPHRKDYYGLLLMVTTMVTYIKEKGCLYQDFYSGADNVYFPPPAEAPSLVIFNAPTIDNIQQTGLGITVDGRYYSFYLLKKPAPDIDLLREHLDDVALNRGEPDSFLDKLTELKVEYQPLLGINNGGLHQFRMNNRGRLPIDNIMPNDEATPERISKDLLNLIGPLEDLPV